MLIFAKLSQNHEVEDLIILSEDKNENAIEFITTKLGHSGKWLQANNQVGIGFSYNEELDAFIPSKPFGSWILNEETCQWESPTPYPEDGEEYSWNEETESWVANA
jgi:hypothetical protein